MIPIRLAVRRSVIVVAVALSLVVGVAAVRAAAVWTAASAPLTDTPVSASTLSQRLLDEQARSSSLEDQLTALTGQTQDLTAALSAAQAQIGKDAGTAKDLRDQLAQAKKRLAALNQAIHTASAASTSSGSGSSTSSGGGAPSGSGSDDGGHGGGGDD